MFLCSLFIAVVASPPPNVHRADTAYDWCDCTDGRVNVTVWYVVHNHTSHENIMHRKMLLIKTDPLPSSFTLLRDRCKAHRQPE